MSGEQIANDLVLEYVDDTDCRRSNSVRPMTTSTLSAFPLFAELISCSSLQRLKGIRFLGAIEYFDDKRNTAGTRFDHTIRTAEMAMTAASMAGLPHKQQLLIVVHALLHDVGHGPFSHSSESYFQERYGLNHHVRFLQLLSDERSDFVNILTKYSIIESYRAFVSSPSRFPVMAAFFFGPLNVDTIEGITRAAKYFDYRTKIQAEDLLRFIAKPRPRGLQLADDFWELKDKLYSERINSPVGVTRDELVTEILIEAGPTVSRSDFCLTDIQFEKRFEGIIRLLREKHLKQPNMLGPKNKKQRVFRINGRSVPRKQTELSKRYSHRTIAEDSKNRL